VFEIATAAIFAFKSQNTGASSKDAPAFCCQNSICSGRGVFLDFFARLLDVLTRSMRGVTPSAGHNKNPRRKQGNYQTFDHMHPFDFDRSTFIGLISAKPFLSLATAAMGYFPATTGRNRLTQQHHFSSLSPCRSRRRILLVWIADVFSSVGQNLDRRFSPRHTRGLDSIRPASTQPHWLCSVCSHFGRSALVDLEPMAAFNSDIVQAQSPTVSLANNPPQISPALAGLFPRAQHFDFCGRRSLSPKHAHGDDVSDTASPALAR